MTDQPQPRQIVVTIQHPETGAMEFDISDMTSEQHDMAVMIMNDDIWRRLRREMGTSPRPAVFLEAYIDTVEPEVAAAEFAEFLVENFQPPVRRETDFMRFWRAVNVLLEGRGLARAMMGEINPLWKELSAKLGPLGPYPLRTYVDLIAEAAHRIEADRKP